MKFDVKGLVWTREPREYEISEDKIEIATLPCTFLGKEKYGQGG